MSILLHWNEKENNVFNRENFFRYLSIKNKLATKNLCSSCNIFDHAKQKCTHPDLGCDTNEARIEPWEKEVICPKKIKS